MHKLIILINQNHRPCHGLIGENVLKNVGVKILLRPFVLLILFAFPQTTRLNVEELYLFNEAALLIWERQFERQIFREANFHKVFKFKIVLANNISACEVKDNLFFVTCRILGL